MENVLTFFSQFRSTAMHVVVRFEEKDFKWLLLPIITVPVKVAKRYSMIKRANVQCRLAKPDEQSKRS